ncbi:RHS repeat domain-containing protein [Arthrobacter sp. H14-L1]|uniref:RHS repeat domain-containing protein n=1 Tax=Arthrobacter sp. H14-L1 TaxID=2996697 RepID=UPI002271CD65|nr:RHS repeat-associated core domain-containing protein [Arthrobacter sp. H14-L1]
MDVGTGNVMLNLAGLAAPGVKGDVGVGLVGNSLPGPAPASSALPKGFGFNVGGAGRLSTVTGGVMWTAGDGYSVIFAPVTGSTTAFTAPAGTKADLVKTSTGYTITSRTSATVVEFNTDGYPVSISDRNTNKTLITTTNGIPGTVTGTRGPTPARAVTVTSGPAYVGTAITFSQSTGATTRTAVVTKGTTGDITGYTDPNGKTTTFTAVNGQVTKITAPTGAVMTLTYDGYSSRLTSITQANTSAGSPGNSTIRFTYPSNTQTLVAGPNTDQAVAVASVPHTTYTLTADKRVAAVTDPMGRSQAKTYTGDFDTLTATQGTGTTAGTTTNTYGANTGQSLTKSTSPGGAAGQAVYGNTAASTKYLATSSTDDSGNTSNYTYNGAGNTLTSADAMAATATLTYNTDGTVATALAPGNGTNKTSYGYNTDRQLTTVTPVTGSTLTSRAFTYDAWGRTATATDGRGTTLTYSYDTIGRLTGTTYSDGTPALSYTYNGNGQVTTRTDASGTTTYGYDQLGRLTSRTNTAGGGTISYGYDKASNLTSTTDTRGTTTYAFDASGVPSSMTYQYQGTPRVLAFSVDDRGRRTDTWMDTNPDHTVWAAHTRTSYDTTGRVTGVLAEEQSATAGLTTVVDLTYCHAAGTTAPTCPTTASTDRSKIQWAKDNKTGAATAYTYDQAGRLTKAAITGGSSPATYTYTYDSRGNRLTATTTGSVTSSQSFTVNPANQITSTGYTYDGTGNLTADPNGTYTYNGAQQMTTVTKGGATYNYTYAGGSQNEVLSETTPQGDYKVTYGRTDAQGQPVIEQYTKDALTAYVDHDPVTGEPLMLRTASGKQALYVHDGTGNPAALITNDPYVAFAYDYDPYGTPVLTQVSGGNAVSQNPYTFKDGIQDRTTGWVKYGARWYNPTTGRWTQQDTLDNPLDPANANRYAYAANDPINNSDPLGTFNIFDVIAGVALVSGVVGLGVLLAPEVTVGAGLFAVANFWIGIAGAGAQYGCDAQGGC